MKCEASSAENIAGNEDVIFYLEVVHFVLTSGQQLFSFYISKISGCVSSAHTHTHSYSSLSDKGGI